MEHLKGPGAAKLFADKLKLAIDRNSETDGPPKHSWRVSPSNLGDICVARGWFRFRWVLKVQKPGRINRLFGRGNNREDYFTALLRREGWEVRDYAQRLVYHPESDGYAAFDWDEDYTLSDPNLVDVHQDPWHIAECKRRDKWLLKQWRLVDFDGHESGYSDGRARHPEYTANVWIGVEYKTYNTKRFSNLSAKASVQVADPDYYVQICTYNKHFDLPATLFLAENKNDDDIYLELVWRDDGTADHYRKTAHTIIYSQARPARYAENPTHHECKFCDFNPVCHSSAPVEINCRSCSFCEPVSDGKFRCNRWSAVIPDEKAILAACPEHKPVV